MKDWRKALGPLHRCKVTCDNIGVFCLSFLHGLEATPVGGCPLLASESLCPLLPSCRLFPYSGDLTQQVLDMLPCLPLGSGLVAVLLVIPLIYIIHRLVPLHLSVWQLTWLHAVPIQMDYRGLCFTLTCSERY